jgi:hypothetical protein
MNNSKYLIFILLAFTTIHCKKNAAQVQKGYFLQVTEDGKQYRLTKDSAWTFYASLAGYQDNQLQATVEGPDISLFSFLISDTTTGTYILDSTSSAPKIVYLVHLAVVAPPYDDFTGYGVSGISQNRFSIKINKKTFDYIEGEFGGALEDERTNEIKIFSKGEFRLPLIR